MAFYGVGIDEAIQKLNFQFRLALKKKGGLGIRFLAKVFQSFDINKNSKLDFNELKVGLESIGIFPSIVELQILMKYYDLDKDGSISYEEFVKGLREPLNQRRKALVEKVFAILDKNASGIITVQDIENGYRIESSPDYMAGKKTKEQVLSDVLDNFENIKVDGKITKQEFIDYYTDISLVLPSDDYFISLLEDVWMVKEESALAIEKGKQREHIAAFITKLKTVAAPMNDVMIEKVFKEFNKNKTGGMPIDEIKFMFTRLEIPIEHKHVVDIMKEFDKNKSGSLEYEEFRNFIKTHMV